MFFVTRLTLTLVGGSGGSEEEQEEGKRYSSCGDVLEVCVFVCSWNIRCVLTDGISGPGRVRGDGERAKSKSVLSSDPEQVVLTLQQAGNHVGLAGTRRIDLMTNESHQQPQTQIDVFFK